MGFFVGLAIFCFAIGFIGGICQFVSSVRAEKQRFTTYSAYDEICRILSENEND